MQQNVSCGAIPSLPFLTGLVFLVLKLTGVVAWPWIWVLAPFWIPLAIAFLWIIGLLAFGAVIAVIAVLANW